MAATTGFYSIYDHQRLINEMVAQDLWHQQRYMSPPMYTNTWSQEYECSPPAEIRHYCKVIPEHLTAYYKQLVNYHRQAGFKEGEDERTCCVLKKLGIRY